MQKIMTSSRNCGLNTRAVLMKSPTSNQCCVAPVQLMYTMQLYMVIFISSLITSSFVCVCSTVCQVLVLLIS